MLILQFIHILNLLLNMINLRPKAGYRYIVIFLLSENVREQSILTSHT